MLLFFADVSVVESRPVDKSAGHWGETSSTGLARFGDWWEYARTKRARQPLSCLSISSGWTEQTCCREQTIVFDVGTNATQGLHYGTLW